MLHDFIYCRSQGSVERKIMHKRKLAPIVKMLGVTAIVSILIVHGLGYFLIMRD